MSLGWPDFEDAVCASVAEICGCDAIVTRDPKGFADSPVRIIDSPTALAWLMAWRYYFAALARGRMPMS